MDRYIVPIHPVPRGPAKITDHGKKMTSCDRGANLYFRPRQLHATLVEIESGPPWQTDCRYLEKLRKNEDVAQRSTLTETATRWHLCSRLKPYVFSLRFLLLSARSAQKEAWLELAINRENGTKRESGQSFSAHGIATGNTRLVFFLLDWELLLLAGDESCILSSSVGDDLLLTWYSCMKVATLLIA